MKNYSQDKMPDDLRQKIKTINQRLYRLENTYTESGTSYSKLSGQYRTMEQYALRQPQSKNAAVSQGIYNVDEDKGTIRLKNSKDWSDMSIEERKKLAEVVDKIWNNPDSSTTVGNVKASYRTGYETFMRNHPEAREQDLTLEQYADMWHQYTDKVRADRNSHYGSSEIIMLLEGFNVGYLLKTDQFQDAVELMNSRDARSIDPKARRRNY